MAWVGIQASGIEFDVVDTLGNPITLTWDGSAIVTTDTPFAPYFMLRGPAGTKYRVTVETFLESAGPSGFVFCTQTADAWTPAAPAQTALNKFLPAQAEVTSTDGSLKLWVPL